MNINKKFVPFLSATITGTFMSFIMSGIITAINFGGFNENYINNWMYSFSLVIFIVIPIIMVVRPVVEKIMKKIMNNN